MDTGERVLAGRYRLEEVIGRGGMSTVYRATDAVLGRTVAVKVLLASLEDQDPTYVTRFEREARAAAALANSSVVTVYDTGVDEGARFIVMEYVSGRSLAQILGDQKPLALDEAVRIAGRVASALGAAHSAGILHRDIKPANVMVADNGAVKVLDFGIARKLDGTTLTQIASVVGTAAYMAPERALGKPGDARADIYSLGCLLYAMLVGHPPYSGELAAVLLHQQINAEPEPPSRLREGIPVALDGLVLAMLAKSPDARPATATEVQDRLATVLEREAAAPAALAAPIAPTAPTAKLDRTAATSALARPRQSDHRRRAIIAAAATAALALAVIALASGGSSPHTGSTAGAPPRSAATTPATTPASAPVTTRAATASTATSAPPTTTQPATQPATPAGPTGPTGPAGGPPGHGGPKPGKAKHGGDGGD